MLSFPGQLVEVFFTLNLRLYIQSPPIIELWGLNVQTQVESKKNFDQLTGK